MLLPEQAPIKKTVKELNKKKKPENKNNFNKGKTFEVPYLNFTAATFAESGVVPPDAMGVVGPSQFILAANGRIRSFNKESGKADQGIDLPTDIFFQPVSKNAFTTDSRIRYDRFSDRWVIVMLALATPVRIVLAISDKGTITNETIWSFLYIEPYKDLAPDYPTLGIDRNALYIGANIMTDKGYHTSDGYVIPKKGLLEGKPQIFAFKNLVDPKTFEGPLSPQGVDNFDPDSNDGYFIGNDGNGKRLMLRRIKDPGTQPFISNNIPLPIIESAAPLPVPQKGSLKSNKFFLQGFDKRLSSSHIRKKSLYTSYNVGVNNKGETNISKPTRDGCLWLQISLDIPERPYIKQFGTLYQPSKEDSVEERYFWMPGLMTNGLQTLIMGCSTSGNQLFADAAFALRYSDDPLGTLRKPVIYTKSDSIYVLGTPPFQILRYGEYTQPSVDPENDMTLWTIAEYTLAPTNWGLQVARIPASPPAKIESLHVHRIKKEKNNFLFSINGVRENGSAYFDPGEGFAKRLKVEVDANEEIEVASIKWISPTRIDVKAKIKKAEILNHPIKIKIINPDGQILEKEIQPIYQPVKKL